MPHASFAMSPNWLTAAALQPAPVPEVWQWLFNQDSLTRRLTKLSANGFSVVPLLQGWAPLRDDECAVLGVAAGSSGWVREVYLCGHDQPWVFARSVAARSALEDSALDLAELGNRSLGELLFSDQAFARGELQVCRYPAAWLPSPDQQEGLWARRSSFSRGPLAVLVAEVFLPSFWPAAGVSLS
ncbi:chorismate--pyruvate lyase family protein [Pseudomonas sp. 5P_3.1_Bac2]|uniref:chorismate--pyruvate lyase family protein n=1 Tax=Pseudomonas sp. 5P_3.1_Bac2 TaxID=2971617 RepID=UPI0021CA57B8|nr:chorismate lyase [Pseudomonas sp. 5P_3.1_Bac2]MCU1718943.1 chorismate lyase [Pseudomonas sp. 5P_3.1_Bac2]